MSKANRQSTTTTLAVELTRRSTIGALLASAALSAPALARDASDDPIFMLIEEHRAARAAFVAAMDAVDAIEDRFPSPTPCVKLGVTDDMTLQIGNQMTQIPGGPFYATERSQINRHIGGQTMRLTDDIVAGRAALNVRLAELLDEWDRQAAPGANPEVDAAEVRRDEASAAETAATVSLLTTAPTTLAGATALLRYIAENHEPDYLMTDCGEAGRGYDALVSSLIVILAPLVSK